MTHFYEKFFDSPDGDYWGCQCPLGLMTHFYGVDGVYHYNAVHEVSMPSRADDSFLRTRRRSEEELQQRVNALSG